MELEEDFIDVCMQSLLGNASTRLTHDLDYMLHDEPDHRSVFKYNLPSTLHLCHIFAIVLCRAQFKVGDVITVVMGCRVPLILRAEEDGAHFKVVRPAYVEGITNCEAVGKVPGVDITLC